MRVVVTGGAGFIGSHLVDASFIRGDHLTVIDDLSTGRATRLPTGANLEQLSVTDPAALRAAVERARPDVIFHLAGQIDLRASVADPRADAETNVLGTINVGVAARATGARVVFASTGGGLYGHDAPIPSHEDLVPVPEAPYGTAKYCAENYLALFNRLYGARHSVLRLGNVYGPRQDPSGEAGVVAIVSRRIARGQRPTIFGDGTQTRDYVYVADVVQAFLAAAEADRSGVWNVGTGVETSVGDLVAMIGKAAGSAVDPEFVAARSGELERSCLATTRAGADLGFTARTALMDGIDKVYRWVAAGEPEHGEP